MYFRHQVFYFYRLYYRWQNIPFLDTNFFQSTQKIPAAFSVVVRAQILYHYLQFNFCLVSPIPHNSRNRKEYQYISKNTKFDFGPKGLIPKC